MSQLNQTPPNPAQSLWDFALAFYAQPQVAEICLQLQDEYQANVCLLIGLRWMDAREDYLDETDFTHLKNHIEMWTREVVEPLRSLRRKLKSPIEHIAQDEVQEQLRTVIKNAELLAEKKLLNEIERWAIAQKKMTQINSAQDTTNLERYLAQLNALNYLNALQ